MREFLLMSLDHRLEIEQDARAALRTERCPRGLRGSRRGHCRLEIARTPQRHPCLNLARRGIVDIQIGRASCRERVGQYVEISVVAVSLKKKKPTQAHIRKSAHMNYTVTKRL